MPVLSQRVFQYCCGYHFGGDTPLIAIDSNEMNTHVLVRSIFEVALRLMGKNLDYSAMGQYQAELCDTIDDEDYSKKIYFKFQGRKFVTHLHIQEDYWMFIIAFPEED